MNVIELVRQARLSEARELLIEGVKRRPSDRDLRYNLAAVLAFDGEFDRTQTHLEAIAATSPELAPTVAVFSALLQAEEERRRVMFENHAPTLDSAGGTALETRRDLLLACRRGDAAAAARQMAALPAVGVAARLSDGATGALRDYDDVLGDVLEVYNAGRYAWLLLSAVRRLEFKPARGLLDLLWAECAIERTDGARYTVHVPVLYAGSCQAEDPAVRCGHKTEWIDQCGVAFRGRGRRVFVHGDRELDVLALRTVEFGG